MTGYGRGEMRDDRYHFTVEIRSVNHRHLDAVIRLPRDLMAQEELVRRRLQEQVYRGRVEVFINQEMSGRSQKKVVVDEGMAAEYCRALQYLEEHFVSVHSELTVEKLAAFPDVLILEKDQPEQDLVVPLLLKALSDALDELLRQREREGERLADDISGRVQHLKVICAALREKSPLVPEQYRQKLAGRLEELFNGREYDKQRFFMEVALFAERCAIDEEIVRLESHLQAFAGEMKGEGAIGRKLDFLLQEMNREANTIAAKSSDLAISRLVVEAKSEIEKIREQVQNIE
ncbi:MAG: YicC/YloC family endoribonuclease [Bacillota bacterium]